MTVVQPTTQIIPNPATGGIALLFLFPLQQQTTYQLQYTRDGISYTNMWPFTTGTWPAGVNSNHSHTVSDMDAGPWIRLIIP